MSVPIKTRNNRLKMIICSLDPGGTKNFSTIVGIRSISRPWVIGIQDQFLRITKDRGTCQHLDQLTLKVPSEDRCRSDCWIVGIVSDSIQTPVQANSALHRWCDATRALHGLKEGSTWNESNRGRVIDQRTFFNKYRMLSKT